MQSKNYHPKSEGKKDKRPARKLLYAILERTEKICQEANEVSSEIINNNKKQVA